jgi:hypothetical protein
MTKAITRQLVSINQRIKVTADLFGIHFPMHIEPYIYSITAGLASDYTGGFWHFYTLNNCGFYMAPDDDIVFDILCDNGYEGKVSADALGIAACLYAYSHLSFSDDSAFAERCAEQFHLLREYMLGHKEASAILRAID